VPGVGEQRQRMAGEGHHHLEDQEPGDQRERDRDQAGVRAGGDTMTVTVIVGLARMPVLVHSDSG